MPETTYTPREPFHPHRQAMYAGQRASCGCWWDALSGVRHVGEHCERRLTGPRCERAAGCGRPRSHPGDCEVKQ